MHPEGGHIGRVDLPTISYKPSSKTFKKKKQPVEAGYQGSKIHRPSSGLDGGGSSPVPTSLIAKKNKKVSLSLYCGAGKTCKGKAILKARAVRGEADTSAKGKNRAKKIGVARYRVKSGQSKKVTVKLNRRGRKMLRESKRRLRGKLILKPSGARKMSAGLAVKI